MSNTIQKFINNMKTFISCDVSVIRSDHVKEFVNKQVMDIFRKHRIIHQRTVPYCPEQNGRAERENRTIVEAARTMIHAKNLSISYWA